MPDSVPFVDFSAQTRRIGPSVRKRMDRVFAHGRFILGFEVEELEEKLCAFTGAKHCVTCASGTDALVLALVANGVGAGDRVVTTPFTFIATTEAIHRAGAKPVYRDVAPDGLLPAAPDDCYALPVDLYGVPAEYDKMPCAIADAAQSFGATYRGKRVGSIAHTTATSFFPTKPLGCYGDGGAVFTDSDAVAESVRELRAHNSGRPGGFNSRLDTLQAAVLLAKLEVFEDELARRSERAQWYREALSGLPVVLPDVPAHKTSAWALYTIRVPYRERVFRALESAGIEARIYYPKLVGRGRFPVAETLTREVLSLPFGPYLPRDVPARVERVLEAVL